MLGVPNPRDVSAALEARIEGHCDWIETILRDRGYIETGFPCWSSLPYLEKRLQGRIQIVHLVRHPVPTALSWLANGAYIPPLLPHLPAKVHLHPSDPGVRFPECLQRWDQMTPFEQCLYFWAEVNAFALKLERTTSAPWLRLHYEHLFEEDGWKALIDFLDLTATEHGNKLRSQVFDQFRFLVPVAVDLDAATTNQSIVEVAGKLGYDPSAVNLDSLVKRYGNVFASGGRDN